MVAERAAGGGAWLRPIVLAGMAGCLAVAATQLVRLLQPQWDGTYAVLFAVLAALEAAWSYRVVRRRARAGRMEGLRLFRLLELLCIFLLFKVYGYVRDGDLLAEAAQMAAVNVCIWIDPETTFGFLLTYAGWFVTGMTLWDFDRLAGAPERDYRHQDGALGRALLFPLERMLVLDDLPEGLPLQRIAGRFFWGAAAILAVAGLARLGLAGLMGTDYPAAPGIVLPVLSYFVLGLALLGQGRLAALRQEWRELGARVGGDVGGRWTQGSLVFFALAVLIALALPTAYTVGLLETAGIIVGFLFAVVWYAFAILVWPLAWLMSQVFQRGEAPPVPEQPELPQQVTQGPGWIGVLTSVAFWTLLLAIAIYVIRSYLRDHPGLADGISASGPVRAVRRFWRTLWRWLRVRLRGLRIALPRLGRARPAGTAPATGLRARIRLGRLAARERVLYYYLSLVERAGREGFPRRPAQTPYEYQPGLVEHLPEAGPGVEALTDAFVETRYSTHAVAPEVVERARMHWQQVRAALRALRRGQKGEPSQ